MTTWWLTLGDFEDTCGRIVELTFDGRRTSTREVLCRRPSPERAVAGKGFTGGCLDADGGLLVCGFNEVYRVSPDGERLEVVLSRDDFNDLHHVALSGDQLWLSNTGLDRVEVFSLAGTYSGGFSLVPALVERRRAEEVLPDDPYFAAERLEAPLHQRRLSDHVHPNHTVNFGGRPLVTRFLDRTLQDLSTMREVFSAPGHPHDGCIHDGHLWMTCTNGEVLACRWSDDRSRLEVGWRTNVFSTGRWGWCRGLWVGDEVLLVGLTRIARMPRVRWCDRPFEGTRTAVLVLERGSGRLLAEADLGHFGVHPKLFSIVEV